MYQIMTAKMVSVIIGHQSKQSSQDNAFNYLEIEACLIEIYSEKFILRYILHNLTTTTGGLTNFELTSRRISLFSTFQKL